MRISRYPTNFMSLGKENRKNYSWFEQNSLDSMLKLRVEFDELSRVKDLRRKKMSNLKNKRSSLKSFSLKNLKL